MSTGKRLAKRSILGTRVAAPKRDGRYYPAIIRQTKQLPSGKNMYTVQFDDDKSMADLADRHLVGPGFEPVANLRLMKGQNCFVTHNGREVSAIVVDQLIDDVIVNVSGQDLRLSKKVEDVRLMESRKSARLNESSDGNTRIPDYSRLVEGEKRASPKTTPSMEVPGYYHWTNSLAILLKCQTASHSSVIMYIPNKNQSIRRCRKRRPSDSQSGDEIKQNDTLDNCAAALVLMSLSCSPMDSESYSGSSSSWQPSPTYSFSDEGIDVEDPEDPVPRKRRSKDTAYQCTWPGCGYTCEQIFLMQRHVRSMHIGETASDDEEDFYYTEVDDTAGGEANNNLPFRIRPHEDHDYQKQETRAISIPKTYSPNKLMRVSPKSFPTTKTSPQHSKKTRGDSKKCRKVYGMENRDLWCTQCKWKKACGRFMD